LESSFPRLTDFTFPSGDRIYAEHMGANLLPCNAVVRLQARTTERRLQSGGSKRVMAKVIEFYIPTRFQKKVAWVPPERRGKVIEFCVQAKKSA